MPVAKRWTVEIYLSEMTRGGTVQTHAEARLRTQDATDVRGHGHTYTHPDDADVPEIGDELAAARALSDLARQLLEAAAKDVEAVTRQPVVRLGH